MLLALLQGFEASICNGDSNLFADLVSRILRFIKKNKEIRYALRFFCVKLREYCCVTLPIVKETIKVSVILLNHCSFSSSTWVCMFCINVSWKWSAKTQSTFIWPRSWRKVELFPKFWMMDVLVIKALQPFVWFHPHYLISDHFALAFFWWFIYVYVLWLIGLSFQSYYQ